MENCNTALFGVISQMEHGKTSKICSIYQELFDGSGTYLKGHLCVETSFLVSVHYSAVNVDVPLAAAPVAY